MNNYLKLIFFCFLNLNLFAQSTLDIESVEKIFPSSPEAFSMTEAARIPVDYYSGLVKIDLPLIELNTRVGDFSLNLKYHSSGNKVAEVASSVGLGWSLESSGVITRVVRGKNDDDINGYVGSNLRGKKINELAFNQLSNSEVLYYSSSEWDSEPDMYYFNFMGGSGSFTLNKQGEVIMMPENDFKIFPAFGPNSSNNYWTLVDKSGVRYKFGVTVSEREYSKVKVTNGIDVKEYDQYISSWYLSEIEKPGFGKISFSYSSGSEILDVRKSEEFRDFNTGSGYSLTTVETKTLATKRLDRIDFTSGYIKVITTEDRLDLVNSFRTSRLELYNNHDELIKGIIFNHDYFNSIENCNSPECKRLKLVSVYEFFKNSSQKLKYDFKYNTNNLPRRDSPQIDHWGYYNSNGLTTLIPHSNPYNINLFREPNEIGTKACVLEEVKFETGGSTKFDYELNSFYDGTSNKLVGGLRVKSIEYIRNSSNSPNVIKNFTYNVGTSSNSSGVVFDLPVYVKPLKIITGITYPDGYYLPQINVGNSVMPFSCNNLLDLNGSCVGYSEVKVQSLNNGLEIYKYTDLNSNPDVLENSDYFNIEVLNNVNVVDFIGNINPKSSPFGGPSRSNGHQRGLLKEKIIKDSFGNIKYHLENFYEEKNKLKNLSAKGVKFNRTFLYNHYDNYFNPNTYTYQAYYSYSRLGFDVAQYQETNGNYKLISAVEKKYDNLSNYNSMTLSYDYSFNKPTNLNSEKKIDSKGDVYETKYEYADSDLFTFNFNVSDMKTLNMISYPIVITKLKNDKIISKVYNEYYSNNNNPFGILNPVRLSKVYNLEINKAIDDFQEFNWYDIEASNFNQIDSRFKVIMEYNKYDDFSNLLEYSKEDGKHVCVIWGYNKTRVIAKIENLNYISIPQSTIDNLQILSDNDNDNCKETTCNEQQLREALNDLRGLYPDSMITTYTYDPLVGITSITDARGDIIYYEYNDLGKLKCIRDHNNNIKEVYDYNFKSN